MKKSNQSLNNYAAQVLIKTYTTNYAVLKTELERLTDRLDCLESVWLDTEGDKNE